jgi:hypothetical protein
MSKGCNFFAWKYFFKPLNGALGDRTNTVHRGCVGKPLKDGTICNTMRKFTVKTASDPEKDGVTQRQLKRFVALLLQPGRMGYLHMPGNHQVLKVRDYQNMVNLFESRSKFTIIFCTKNHRNCWMKFGLKCDSFNLCRKKNNPSGFMEEMFLGTYESVELSLPKKATFVEKLVAVARADGTITPEEEETIRYICQLINIDMRFLNHLLC